MQAKRALFLLIIAAAICVIVIAVQVFDWYGNRVAWMTKAPAQLGVIHSAILSARQEFDEPPPHVLTLLWANYLSPEDFVMPWSATIPSDIYRLDKSLDELAQLNWSGLVCYVRPLAASTGEWEQVGDFYLSKDIWTLSRSDQPSVVVAFTVGCPLDHDLRAVLYSDGRRDIVEGDSWIASQNQLRAKRGLPPLPILP